MPEISRFFGIVIRMYFTDCGPAHFHASYAGFEACMRISPIGILAGILPSRVLALTVEWGSVHRVELLENWRRLESKERPRPVAPLE